MLTQPLLDKLTALGLAGIRAGLEEQLASTQYAELSFEDRLGLLVDREHSFRQNVRLQRLLKAAHFQLSACIEDLDLSAGRGLERRLVLELAGAEWVRCRLNAVVLGPTGAGKTFLACALGQAACRHDLSVRYERLSRLLYSLTLAHADGTYPKVLAALRRVNLLVLDDWLRDPLTPGQTRDLLEVLDDRYGHGSTLIAGQVPIDAWHERLADPTLADGVLDRLVHNAYRLNLKGESQRKLRSPLTMPST
jgi:DNA replication protein DnaC